MGSLARLISLTVFSIASLSPAASPASLPAGSPASSPIVAPPEALKLPGFYRKYLSVGGLAVVGSDKVSDFALREAAYLVERMLEHRPDVREAMVRSGARVAVMAYNEFTTDLPEHSRLRPREHWNKRARGLGGTRENPVTSCAEENLLNYPGDPYGTENIFVHEFGHSILSLGLSRVDKTFRGRVEAAYRQAIAAGMWKSTYAANNPDEYWAEGVQSWFDTNRSADACHNGVNTREKLKAYDAPLSALLGEVFGDGPWRCRRIADRPASQREHLSGYDPARAPRFAWPRELIEWDRKNRRPPPAEPSKESRGT